jgi:hypothetical protein
MPEMSDPMLQDEEFLADLERLYADEFSRPIQKLERARSDWLEQHPSVKARLDDRHRKRASAPEGTSGSSYEY